MKHSGSTSEQSRLYNERIILQAVREQPGISRAQIAELAGLSAQTISVITSYLIEKELVCITGKVKGKRGQPSIKLEINAQGAYGLGINIDRDHISAALVDFNGACLLLRQCHVHFPTETEAKQIALGLIEEVRDNLGDDWNKVQGVGLTMPDYMAEWLESLVLKADEALDLMHLRNAMTYWASDDFKLWLARHTEKTVICENDANASAINELLLSGGEISAQDFFYIFVGAACGGGIVSKGECVQGAAGKAGNFGLIPTAKGELGAWILEALSTVSLKRFFAQQEVTYPSNDNAWQVKNVQALVTNWCEKVAADITPALISIIALQDPKRILLGGRLPSSVLKVLINVLTLSVRESAPKVLDLPPIDVAVTGATSSIVGAAILPLYQTFSPYHSLLLVTDEPFKRQAIQGVNGLEKS
ncbi:putative ROK family transcriptional regulator [Marinomonas sp. MED121]|uniref:ROK family transcriptional regulator n=1 Tax=Marinomonas sp. MED121 TaxID=314277 RepID=UPI00006904A7|nr:ROK family transcriptional regulator [Marinomonas sp. MED121]EAQ64714.1 putative ROK family transcriptional regulator [Marinomonas sp. MED121]